MIRVAHVFYNVHMGQGHKGLLGMYEKKTKKKDVGHSEIAVFINRKFTGVKMLAPGMTFLYHKGDITADIIAGIPRAFGAEPLHMTAALCRAITDALAQAYLDEEAKRAA